MQVSNRVKVFFSIQGNLAKFETNFYKISFCKDYSRFLQKRNSLYMNDIWNWHFLKKIYEIVSDIS